MSWYHWVGGGAAALFGALFLFQRRRNSKKGLILSLLAEKGELTGMELRDAGVGGLVYSYLYELEKDGFVARRSGALPHPERGGRSRHYYRLKGTSTGAVA